MKYVLISVVLCLVGCAQKTYNTEIIDGTSLIIGLYVPYQGGTYGLNLLKYTSGRYLRTDITNEMESIHTITNGLNVEKYGLNIKN